MAKRVTVTLDEDNIKMLRVIQAKKIRESDRSVSFSRVINDVLRKHFK